LSLLLTIAVYTAWKIPQQTLIILLFLQDKRKNS